MRRFFCMLLCLLVTGCMGDDGNDGNDGRQQGYKRYEAEPEISVYLHETDEIKLMKLEEYLEGVVAGEMHSDWPQNALAAQAIIARTFTLEALEKGTMTARGTNASTDIREFQAYNAAAVNSKVREAVKRTRGQIAVYNGVPIKGWFHASAGGRTAGAAEGLDYPYDAPYAVSVYSPDELAPADIREWRAAFSLAEVTEAVRQLGVAVETITELSIGRRGRSGRAETIIVNRQHEVVAPRLRLALNSTILKSMLLQEISVTDNQVVFTGSGYGHGVGMSQWGANKLAQDGKSPEEIIKHYFSGVKIEQRW